MISRAGWWCGGRSQARNSSAKASLGRHSDLAASERAGAAASSTASMAGTVRLESHSPPGRLGGGGWQLRKRLAAADWWPSPIAAQQPSSSESRSSLKRSPPTRSAPTAPGHRARAGPIHPAVSDAGGLQHETRAGTLGGIQGAVASCLEVSARLAEQELAASAWDQQPVDSNSDRPKPPAANGAKDGGGVQHCDVDIGGSVAVARSSAAALAQREDAMAEACLQAVCDAGDFRRRWLVCRRQAAALEAELCVVRQAEASCSSASERPRKVSQLSVADTIY